MPNPWWLESKPGDPIRSSPWLHPAAALYIDYLVQPNWRVLEHGSGGSTMWLAQRSAHVVAVENDQAWYQRMLEAVPENVSILHWDKPRMPPIEIMYSQPFDLLLIDGKPPEQRKLYLDAACDLVRPGGVVVLDNANRAEYVDAVNRLKLRSAHYVSLLVNPPGFSYAVTDFFRLRGGADDENWI